MFETTHITKNTRQQRKQTKHIARCFKVNAGCDLKNTKRPCANSGIKQLKNHIEIEIRIFDSQSLNSSFGLLYMNL